MNCGKASRAVPDDAPSTVDAFHRGRFHLVQPARGAHRAGMDAMVLAAAVPGHFAGLALDFGSGTGAVGLAVLSRCPSAKVLLVEKSAEMAGFASQTLALPQNERVAGRGCVINADVGLTGKARGAAGLTDRMADFVLMNPPFNDYRDRATPAELRRQAHVADEALFAIWLRSAAAVLKSRGVVGLIARPASLPVILDALDGRFGGTEIVPIHPAADKAAIRIVVRATKGSRGGLSLAPPLLLHESPANGPTARAEALINGQASLFGD
jgi:tRNA1(Val) A37 N6-methylase TrmN6